MDSWRDWLQVLGVTLAVVVASYVVLILLARRLPPGLLRDLVEFLPACVTTARRLRRSSAVPRRAKAVRIALFGRPRRTERR